MRSPSGGAGADTGCWWRMGGFGGYLREDRQHREHRRYHEHPVGEEAPVSDAHRQERWSPTPHPGAGDAQLCPNQILTAGPEGPGRPLSPGSPRGPWGRGEDTLESPRKPFSPFKTSSHTCAFPVPALLLPAVTFPGGLTPSHPISWGILREASPKGELFPHHLSPQIPIPFFWPRPDPRHGPQGRQHSPSAQEHRSRRGCQAHPRRKDNIEGPAPEDRQQ